MGSQSMMAPTPTTDDLPRRFSDFETLGEALDYAATGRRGLNFHDARGNLARAYPFSELRADAIACAHRLIAHGVKPEDRVALVAETGADFAQLFFGIVYAGGKSEEHTSELQSLMRISYAVFCLKKKKNKFY